MIVLVDTSVWVDHLRNDNERLRLMLESGEVLTHPFIIGELACGNLRNRNEILSLLEALPFAAIGQHEEVLLLVSERSLHGKGLGWIDMHLIASALIHHCSLWTLDKSLHRAAVKSGIAH